MVRCAMTAVAVLLAVPMLLPAAAAQAGGQEIFLNSCGNCHFQSRDPAKRDEMVAPPIDMMAAHIRLVTKGDREAFVRRVVDYIRAPAPGKSVDPMAVERFGLMPAIGDTYPDLTEDDLKTVANWMFDAFADAQIPPGMGTGMGPGSGGGMGMGPGRGMGPGMGPGMGMGRGRSQ